MFKGGLTLIELLVVVIIIAILAGGAVPYVQNYLEDARLSRAGSDLNEIRNAIMRYETDQAAFFDPGFNKTGADYKEALKAFQQKLVGPYVMQAMTDPWGRPYYFSFAASMVFSGAEDGDLGTNIVSRDIRPAMAPTRAWWSDNNNNSVVDTGDVIDIKFSRPIGGFDVTLDNNFVVTPPKGNVARTQPFGSTARFAFTDAADVVKKHPRGNNWLRIVVQPGSTIEAGDQIVASGTIFDTAEASIAGRGDKGVYEDDKVKGEDWFPDNGTIIANKCSDVGIRLRAAQ